MHSLTLLFFTSREPSPIEPPTYNLSSVSYPIEVPALQTPPDATDWDELIPSPDAPPLRLAEIEAECQGRPGQELIDRLDTVCGSALPHLSCGLMLISDAG